MHSNRFFEGESKSPMENRGRGVRQTRRQFLGKLGILTAATLGADALGLVGRQQSAAGQAPHLPLSRAADVRRRNDAFDIREDAATAEKQVPIPAHQDNGDEDLYPNKIGNYTKGLPHDTIGEVSPAAYTALITALTSGTPSDFENIPLGGTVKLSNPQAGLAFDIEGTDSHQMSIPAAPALASAERADEAVELYWQAFLRDVPFSQFSTNPGALMAVNELDRLTNFQGPRDPNTGQVTAGTLFRGLTPDDLVGPYLSQFLYKTVADGPYQVKQKIKTTAPIGGGGADFQIDFKSWLACQNGQGPFPPNVFDPTPRFIRTGRDLGQYVHIDQAYQAYLNACLYLAQIGAPFNSSNPYLGSKTQSPFVTFGIPHILTLLAEVTTRAFKAIWYQKWFVHRTTRPEEFGGLVHKILADIRTYPLHRDILNSQAVQQVFSRNGTYLLPAQYPEGCPQHPSYGQGHAVLAGAATTLLKAFFDENFVFPSPVVASDDGLSLIPYTGSDAGQMTTGGELNKLTGNIGLGRNYAGVHWRSDYTQAALLGETVAISILADQRNTYNESFDGFTFTKFDGTQITV
jgi:hypothetical protein